MNGKKDNFLFYLLIIIGITLLFFSIIFFVVYYFTNSNECVNEPFVYGAKKLEENYGGSVVGMLLIISPGKEPLRLTFNSTDFSRFPIS